MKIANRQQLLVIIAVTAAVLFVADRVAVGPLMDLWKSRAKQITELRKQITQGTAVVQREQSIRARWDLMRHNTLPLDPPQAAQQLLRAFDTWARNSRVNITLISPQWKHEDEYMTLECRVDAAGDMETLDRFLYDIERDPMALKLDSVELSAHDETGQQMTLAVQINGLVLTPTTP